MVFSSLTFLCAFLPATLAFYFLVPAVWKNAALVIASAIFYTLGDPVAIFLVGALVLINFELGLRIERRLPDRHRAILAIAVGFNLSILIVFKYTGFIVENLNVVAGAVGLPALTIRAPSLPLGISFFTFHIISYLVDIARGNARAQRSRLDFALYILNFPQLIAGPIIRYREMAWQFSNRRQTLSDFDTGIGRFVLGLAKKLLIANPIGAVADQVFAIAPADLTASALWLGAIAYTLQIYFDFSGYSDMAIGLARMFGFRFPENFAHPYSATSMQDFWRRWHMSLSRWFRDYVYIPLGGNRHGSLRTTLNLWTVFLLVGAWHGASWNFIVWGAWHGLFLAFERTRLGIGFLSLPLVVRHIYVFAVVVMGWVFFRSDNLMDAASYIGRMFAPQATGILSATNFVGWPMALLIMAALAMSFPLMSRVDRYLGSFPASAYRFMQAGFVAVALIFSIATMAVEQNNPFIYFRF